MKNWNLVLIISLLLIINGAYCQKDFREGYILQNNNDTIFGFINYNNWGFTPQKIEFKITLENPETVKTASEIKEFYVNNEKYISSSVEIPILPTQNYEPNYKYVKDTLFIQVLIEGSKNLYLYNDIKNTHVFYIGEKQNLEMLIYKKYIKLLNNGSIVNRENKKFVGQLTIYMKDWTNIYSLVNKVTYSRKSLEKLFKAFYKENGTSLSYINTYPKGKSSFNIFSGVVVTSLVFNNINLEMDRISKAVSNPDKARNLFLGLGYSYTLPRFKKRISVSLEALYTKFNYEFNYVDTFNSNENVNVQSKLGLSYMKFNCLVSYKYPIKKIYIEPIIGFSTGYAFNVTNEYYGEYWYSTIMIPRSGKAIELLKENEQSFILATRLSRNNISLEFRFEKGNGFSYYEYFSTETSRLYGILRYQF